MKKTQLGQRFWRRIWGSRRCDIVGRIQEIYRGMDAEYGGDIFDELLLSICWDDVVSHAKGKESIAVKEKGNGSSLNSHSTELDNEQAEDIGDDSDAPSWISEDLEDSEDDIQMEQSINK
ncbi:hypothetical protein Leryth_017803 [Lithospermum erythrorhizon]|nr:hypothetical protein Leryth_017803 [Lithospermum erythrorhizon]